MILLFLYLYSCVIGFFAIKNSGEKFLFKFIFIFFSSFIVLFFLKPIKWLVSTKQKL